MSASKQAEGGDDLEGNLEYDDSIPVGHSESEDSEGELQTVTGIAAETENAVEREDDPDTILRKFLNPHTANQQPRTEAANVKKRAKLQALRAKKKYKSGVTELRLLSSEEQYQRLWEMYVSAHTAAGFTLTPVEIEDRKNTFTPSRLVQLPQTRTLEQLPTHLKSIWPSWKTPSNDPGCPKILVLTYSALRAVAFTKALRGLRKNLHVAKLFSKHLKVDEQKKELQKGDCEIAVGTPNRVLKLVGLGALSFLQTSCVIIDASKDVKTTTILDMSGVREDFFKLFHSQIISNPNLRVCLY